jgi:hypothetical protein
VNLLALYDELQGIAREGLRFAEDPYDRERCSRLLELASEGTERRSRSPRGSSGNA